MNRRRPAAAVFAAVVAGTMLLPATAQAAGALTVNAPKRVVVPDSGCTKIKGSVKVKTRPGAKVVFKAKAKVSGLGQTFDAPTMRLGASKDKNRDGVVRLGGKQRLCAKDLKQSPAAPFLPLLEGQTLRAKVTLVAKEQRPGKDKVSRDTSKVKLVF